MERERTSSQEDLVDPLSWVEQLSQEQLKEWLRLALWTRSAVPVIIPSISRSGVEISRLFKQGSSSLKVRVRKVIPELLQEWGRDDPLDVLDDLLIVCGRLRCAGAAVVIPLIISERLGDRPEAISLRQRCLSVLSGFGCTEATVHIFERYIDDIEYAATCYRALYRYDLSYAATALPGITKTFQDSSATGELEFVLRTLSNDLHTQNEATELLIKYLKVGPPDEIVNVLDLFREVGILTTALIIEARSDQRVQFSKLLLERCSPATFSELLPMLESMGISLHGIKKPKGEETMLVRAVDRSTDRKIEQPVIATSKLKGLVLNAIARGNEMIANKAAAAGMH